MVLRCVATVKWLYMRAQLHMRSPPIFYIYICAVCIPATCVCVCVCGAIALYICTYIYTLDDDDPSSNRDLPCLALTPDVYTLYTRIQWKTGHISSLSLCLRHETGQMWLHTLALCALCPTWHVHCVCVCLRLSRVELYIILKFQNRAKKFAKTTCVYIYIQTFIFIYL